MTRERARRRPATAASVVLVQLMRKRGSARWRAWSRAAGERPGREAGAKGSSTRRSGRGERRGG